ncbi:uncharacterized protein PFL1_00383 [Pseudozyma flocculosa PF-1]|uniref:uncharacterized protein n=1 Tax=Pseudozyma flocculosa PF-1 TaxID=1277687 RepID=UPI0004561B51|nr:uncharacterized protein PFL1_00383 [Pseudozyma flocculosa PF-1]EPQ32186.1 hypothetical protein PFL1_00383 [Pseudozyma flocculosa PF-1]
MPAIPVKVVGEDFLANHIGQLLVRQPRPSRDSAVLHQQPSKVDVATTRLTDSTARDWVATEHVTSHSLRDAQAVPTSMFDSIGQRASSDTDGLGLSKVRFGDRESFSSIGSVASLDSRPGSAAAKDGASEPDLARGQLHSVAAGYRHRRTGSEALVSPTVSFTTTFGSKPRKPRTRTRSQATSGDGNGQLSRNASIRSSLGCEQSNGSVSPLDIYAQSPWVHPSSHRTPPLQSVDELAAHEQWSAVFNSDALRQSAAGLNLRLAPSKATVTATAQDPIDPKEVVPSGEAMSRHSSAQRAKLLLVPKGSDGRTFRFVEPDSDSESDVAAQGDGDDSRGSAAETPASSSETSGPVQASRALNAAISRDEPRGPSAASTAPLTAPSHTSHEAPKKPTVRRMTLLERTMAAERGAKINTIEILGQKIERRGQQPVRPKDQAAASSPTSAPSRPSQHPVKRPEGYGQGRRTFKLRPVGDSLTELKPAVPVVLPVSGDNISTQTKAVKEDRTRQWAREHSRNGSASQEDVAKMATSLSSHPDAEESFSAGQHRPSTTTKSGTDYFSSWSTAKSRPNARRDAGTLFDASARAPASYMTHTTSSSSSTDVSDVLQMTEPDGAPGQGPLTTPVTSPETPLSEPQPPEKPSGPMATTAAVM